MCQKTSWQRSFLALLIVFSFLFGFSSCSMGGEEIHVTWIDSDGTLIESQEVLPDYDPGSRALPSDTNLWHYTGWTISRSGNVVVCTAKRVGKKHYVWKDYNGDILKESFIASGETASTFDLPKSSDKWVYSSWEQSRDGDQVVYQAVRNPNVNFFVGNVFQIVTKDSRGEPIGSGSGFVINEEGWFITNNHVMESGYTATAFFDIKDPESGQQYTQLNVIGGVYHNDKTDVFIGKLENYGKIKSYYNAITFTEEYTVGESSYSVGYPNSSIKIEINSGKVLEEYSDIYGKIDGVYYVLSDSYIAPGSSGGILVNENFEVIGITTMGLYSDSNQNYYVSYGSVPYLLFKQNLQNLKQSNLKSLAEIYKN